MLYTFYCSKTGKQNIHDLSLTSLLLSCNGTETRDAMYTLLHFVMIWDVVKLRSAVDTELL